ncbi:MAG: hypothetical protein PHT62_06770 [Desulfotomaculaceae bacterium]|nr:hypothetical protein [Desulfotomaculaceae bacterium]
MFKKIALLIFCILLVAAAGCSAQNQSETNSPVDAAKAKAVMNDFQNLTQNDAGVEEIAGFIADNITYVSEEDASKLVDQFEQIQKDKISELETLFFDDTMQSKIISEYSSITAGNEIKDTELKELLAKTKNSGYKVETAEGTYFPIIDYSFYKEFRDNVAPDLKDYINIMAVESDKVPAKDAALVIGWDDVLNRALDMEEFLSEHQDSMKADEVKELYKKYFTFTLYGLNNTPLFSYGSNTMDAEAREVYEKVVKDTGNSEFLKTLGEYMTLIKNNNYTLNDEITQYRDNVIKGLK